MQVFSLTEGTYSVNAGKQFTPFNPAIDHPKNRPASLFINVQPFLVKLKNSLILLDTGLGFSDKNGDLILHKNIRNAGFNPDDVELVLMSHLHSDHAGGMIHHWKGKTELSFPNAKYVIQRGEWESAFTAESSSYNVSVFDFLQRNAHIDLTENSGSYNNQIHFELTGAHCPFHQVFLLEENNKKVFFGGDVLPEPEELLRKFIAKYDFNGRKAMELREIFGKKAAAENWKCLFYHAKSKMQAHIRYRDEMFEIV